MPDVSIDVEVFCASCGDGLCNQTESTTGQRRGQPQFRVLPCERCLMAARSDGYNEGHEEAVAEYEAAEEAEEANA